ncbi:MAG: PD40 domain-containing protein [Candidatus Eisenbacteria bacterium]|nr:PD40 domain-containing protein [Candidatus Eisenbacteria bacterium]
MLGLFPSFSRRPSQTRSLRPAGVGIIALLATASSFAPAFAEDGETGSASRAGGPAAAVYEASVRDGEVLLPRHPAPSPDGSRIAFCYQGDLWVVPAEGGEARRLTAHPAIESYPLWSPDGNWIAFTSDRNGNDDVFALPLNGGALRQLTFDSDSEYVSDWAEDGSAVIVHSRRHVLDGRNSGLWWVPVAGGAPGWIQPVGGSVGVLSPDRTRLVFVRTATSWWRRGYEGEGRSVLVMHELEAPLGGGSVPEIAKRSSVKRSASFDPEVETQGGWLADVSLRPGGTYTELTTLASERGVPRSQHDRSAKLDLSRPELEYGGNLNPSWFSDGDHILYQSETHGVANLKVMSVTTGKRAWVTRFVNGDGRLRHASLSRDGSLAVFEYEDGIYAVDLPEALPNAEGVWPTAPGEPRRISVRLPFDERIAPVVRLDVNGGANEFELSPDDEQFAFVKDGDIFAMKASEDEPWAYALTSDPARDQEIAWSPDSKSLVFASDRSGNHDLYVIRSADPDEPRLARTMRTETTRLTDTAEDDHDPSFSPDGERIAFRRGNGNLVTIRPDGSGEKTLVEGWSDIDYSWSPDGKWIAYVHDDTDFNGDIYLIPADGSAPAYNLTRYPDNEWGPSWSPDGKILAFVSNRRFPDQRDIWYVRLTKEDDELAKEDRLDGADDKGSKKGASDDPKGSKKSGASGKGSKEGDAKKSASGKKGSDAKKDADDGDDEDDESGKRDLPEVRIDFDGLSDRMVRLTSLPGNESGVWVTEDGKEFVFLTDTDGKRDLWKIRWDGEEETRLTQGGTNPSNVRFDSNGKRIYYLKGGRIQSIGIGGGDSKSYAFEADIEVDRFARRQAVFEEAWREIGNKFYDPDLHGADWERIHETYRGWAGAASTYRDFHDVLKMMLGEVEASHMNVWGGPGDWAGERYAVDERDEGIGASPEGPWDVRGYGRDRATYADLSSLDVEDGLDTQTAELGLFYDPSFTGPGLRVLRVVPKGPTDRVDSRVEPGETVLSIDGTVVGSTTNLAPLLDRRSGKRVRLEVKGADGKTRDVVVRPVSRGELRELLYDVQVEMRRDEVARATEGSVAYIHIRSMDVSSFEAFERDLYAEAHGKDALIIDVRDNGGGWTTDLLLTSLNASEHATTIARGGGPGYPQDRRLLYAWTKPVVVLCNQNSFSNAEIFSWAIQATDRGPVVGVQTYGGVISTGGMSLGDGTWLRLPFRGWYNVLDGTNLEAEGCRPDVVVVNDPLELASGQDSQLQTAISLAKGEITPSR